MAMQTWSKALKQRHDPIHFLLRRSLFPEARQKDHLLRQRMALAQDLHWKDLKGHYGCVNAIEFSQGSGEFIASGKHAVIIGNDSVEFNASMGRRPKWFNGSLDI